MLTIHALSIQNLKVLFLTCPVFECTHLVVTTIYTFNLKIHHLTAGTLVSMKIHQLTAGTLVSMKIHHLTAGTLVSMFPIEINSQMM